MTMDGDSAVLDFSAMDTPTLEPTTSEETTTAAPETTAEETTIQQPEGETPGSGAPEKPPEGKAPPLKAVRDAVKAFSEANPELGKHLKSLLDNEGRIRAYQETYPDVDTARSTKAAIEAVGGLEGIAELSKLRDTMEETDSMIQNGDPEVIERIFSDQKEGGVKLLPHYMNRVEKENPEAFGNSIRPHLVRNLQGAGFEGALAGLLRAVADKPEAKEIVDSMVNWFSEQKRQAEKSNLDSLEPERQKFQQRETALVQRERKQFEHEVNLEVVPHMNQEFGKQMRAYLQNDTRPDTAKQDIARAWVTELGKAMEKDKNQIESMMKSKNRNKTAIANYAKTRMSALAAGVTKKIVDAYKLTPGKAAPKKDEPKPGEPTVSTGVVRVNQKPSDDTIDWDKDPDRILFISGKAYLKGSGRLVKWR